MGSQTWLFIKTNQVQQAQKLPRELLIPITQAQKASWTELCIIKKKNGSRKSMNQGGNAVTFVEGASNELHNVCCDWMKEKSAP